MFRADLHCHSTVSDGTLAPDALIRHAVERGLQGLAITDHDTFASYEMALPVAKEVGLELLIGAEFSAHHQLGSVHILGYGFDPANEALLALCRHHVGRREGRNREILRLLKERGMSIEESEVLAAGKQVYGRPHIAQAMVERGYVRDVREAFNRWLGDGKLCFASQDEVSVEETIQKIQAAEGLAIIAHPHLIRDQRLLRALLDLPFDGIEGFYGNFPRWVDDRFIRIGEEKGWLVTGGSDFHGAPKPHIGLGASWVGEETFRRLADHQT